MKQALGIAWMALCLLLAGCGGKGDSAPTPADVKVVAGDTSAVVTWTQESGTEYWVWVAQGADVSTSNCAGTAGCKIFVNVTSPNIITGLTNGTTYRFTVAAKNSRGTGPASAVAGPVVVGTPLAPAAPTATAGVKQATLHWTAPAVNNGAAITGYVVTPYLAGVAQTSVTYPTTATTRTLTGLQTGASYTFTVAATNSRGTGPSSSPSNPVKPT